MELANVFKDGAFTLASLTDAINKLPFKPKRIGQMGLFEVSGIPTTTVVIEEKKGILQLVPTKLRGESGKMSRSAKRTVRSIPIPHCPLEDAVQADEVQNVRAFGSTSELQSVAQIVNEKMATMKGSHEVTLEYHRMGALTGLVLDADGTTEVLDLFDAFEVDEQTEDFILNDSDTDVRSKCIEVSRKVEAGFGEDAQTYEHVHAFVGKDFFDKLIAHTSVKAAFANWTAATNLSNDPRKGFPFGGIIFEEYHGKIGSVSFIADDEARFFPVGASGLFKTIYGPANFVETVNTIGLPYYAKQKLMDWDMGVELHTQTNPLNLCLRPRVLVKGLLDGTTS